MRVLEDALKPSTRVWMTLSLAGSVLCALNAFRYRNPDLPLGCFLSFARFGASPSCMGEVALLCGQYVCIAYMVVVACSFLQQ